MQALLDYLYEGFYSGRILLGTFLFAHFLLRPRLKAYFSWPLVIVVVAVTAGFNPLVKLLQADGWQLADMRILHGCWYTGLLFVLFAVLAACYRGDFREYVYVFTCGLLVECSTFGLFRLFYDIGVVELRVNTVFSILLEAFFSAAVYIGVYFLFRRILRAHGKIELYRRPALLLYFLFVIALIMFLRFNLQAIYEEVYGTENGWIVSLTLGLIPIALLATVTGAVRIEGLAGEAEQLGAMLVEKERQYRLSAETIDIINRKCHDIKRQLRAIELVDEAKRAELVQGMERAISVYDAVSNTDNAALNTILSEKQLYCTAHGISLTCAANGKELAFFDPVDLYVLLSNLLDNAIEAAEKLEEPEKRVISLTASVRNGSFLVIRTDNYFEGGLSLRDGLPQTSKRDRAYHGFGVKSIRHIAEKYGGTFHVEADGDIFVALVDIPLPAREG